MGYGEFNRQNQIMDSTFNTQENILRVIGSHEGVTYKELREYCNVDYVGGSFRNTLTKLERRNEIRVVFTNGKNRYYPRIPKCKGLI